MRRFIHPTIPNLLDERGFTLIEMLVAMVAGMVVMGALFGILEVSLHQTANLTDRVQANQNGRIAMTRIIDELHSTCISPEFRPILEKSNGNELWFINAYSNQANIPYTAVSKHQIIWNKAEGKLIDKRYPATGGTWPEYEFTSTASPSGGTILASNIAESNEEGHSKVFEYFRYNTTSSSASETLTPLNTINPEALAVPLSKTGAAAAASVLVRFTAYPTDGDTQSGRGVALRNQVTLAMSAPSSETPIEAAPCE
jgi:prepilin-type N-terminal cleavage/methylation domain-containing protein